MPDSAEKYQLIFEHAGEAIFIAQDGKLAFVNPAMVSITGYSVEEITSRPFIDFIHADDRDMVRDRHARPLRGETLPPRFSFRILHKNGGCRWVELDAVLITWNGRPATLNFMTDITDRKRAEEALRASENRYYKLFQHMKSGVAIYEAVENGADFVFRDLNAAAERIERIRKAEVLGRRVTEVFPGVVDFGLLAVFQRVWKTGNPEDHGIAFYRDDRITGWRENHVYKLPSGEVVSVYEDISDRKRAEEALRESERELKALFKSMINAFVLFESVFDRDGRFVSYRFVYINDAYERITGVKNDEVKGKTVHEVWPRTEASWIKAYGDVATTGVPSSFDMYHEPTGKLYHCNVYRPWDTQDRFCVVFEDITDRKRAEDKLKEREDFWFIRLMRTFSS